MSETNDISRLFSRFGGHPDQYQEIGRDNLARSSEARWPLLASVGRQAATMQAVRDMGQASPAMTPPEGLAPAAALRASASSAEQRPRAQVRHITDAGAPAPMPGGAEQGAAGVEDKAPLAQFIPPRRRTLSPMGMAASGPAQPSLKPQVQPQVRPEARTPAQGWRADMPSSPSPAFTSPVSRLGVQGRPQSPLQAMFARLERAGERGGPAVQPASEATGSRASIFERLARR